MGEQTFVKIKKTLAIFLVVCFYHVLVNDREYKKGLMDKKVSKCNFAFRSMNSDKFLCGFELKSYGICTEEECELWDCDQSRKNQ
jgi:hypothetical protein